MRASRRLAALLSAGLMVGAVAAPAALARPAASAGTPTKATRSTKPTVTKVAVVDNRFVPMKVTIHVGDKVDFVWNNKNINTHNVTLVRGPKGVSKTAFTSIDGAREIHFEKAFTIPGTYLFVCTIHTNMVVTVTVKK